LTLSSVQLLKFTIVQELSRTFTNRANIKMHIVIHVHNFAFLAVFLSGYYSLLQLRPERLLCNKTKYLVAT